MRCAVRPPRASWRRVAPLLAAAVCLLGLTPACGAATPGAVPATSCTMPDPAPALARGSLRLPTSPRVLVFGDSYTEGIGAEPRTKGFAYLVGRPLGWRVTVDGSGGTGYTTAGPNGVGTYLQRLPAQAGRSYDLVVLQGSSNDRDVSYAVLQDAVTATVAAVRAEFPSAVVLLLGPSTPYGKPDPVRLLSRCTLATYASTHYLAFVDPIGERWFVPGDGRTDANPANGHPSNAGYAKIADRFEADVRVLLGTPASSASPSRTPSPAGR